MLDRNFWGGSDMVFQCLVDKKRAITFKKVISKCVKEGDVVVDFGTGTGILALFAAAAGAKKVYAVEADQNLYNALELNLSNSPYKDKIKLIKGDATSIKFTEKIDVVICEMIATGLIDEAQIPVMNNAIKYCKKDTKFIPSSINNFADLVYINNSFYGHKMEVIQYEYTWAKKLRSKPLTKKVMYKQVNFSEVNDNDIDCKIRFKIIKSGTLNGLRISNQTYFPNNYTLRNTAAFCMPMIIPIKEFRVKRGEDYEVQINYKMCEGFDNFHFDLKKL